MRFGQPKRGQMHPLARLTDAQAQLIKQRYRAGEASLRELAREARVDSMTIWRVVQGISYKNGNDKP